MPAPQKIIQLVDTFRTNEREYMDPRYVELQTRINFIDPFFKELGWDVSNERGLPPDQADVFFEDTIRADDVFTEDVRRIVGKRPDYSFRIDGRRRFYVEAKKPSEECTMY